MNKYAKLLSGEVMVIVSDNMFEKTMDLGSLDYLDECGEYNIEFETTNRPYSEIAYTDNNLSLIQLV